MTSIFQALQNWLKPKKRDLTDDEFSPFLAWVFARVAEKDLSSDQSDEAATMLTALLTHIALDYWENPERMADVVSEAIKMNIQLNNKETNTHLH